MCSERGAGEWVRVFRLRFPKENVSLRLHAKRIGLVPDRVL